MTFSETAGPSTVQRITRQGLVGDQSCDTNTCWSLTRWTYISTWSSAQYEDITPQVLVSNHYFWHMAQQSFEKITGKRARQHLRWGTTTPSLKSAAIDINSPVFMSVCERLMRDSIAAHTLTRSSHNCTHKIHITSQSTHRRTNHSHVDPTWVGWDDDSSFRCVKTELSVKHPGRLASWIVKEGWTTHTQTLTHCKPCPIYVAGTPSTFSTEDRNNGVMCRNTEDGCRKTQRSSVNTGLGLVTQFVCSKVCVKQSWCVAINDASLCKLRQKN